MSGPPVQVARKEYDPQDESMFRESVRKVLKNSYDKRGDLVVPLGKNLTFTSAQGQKTTFGYTAGGEFTVKQDTGTPFSLASITYVSSVESSLDGAISTVSSEVVAARQGEASLTAKVTQLSTATSTVDGKLSASYALTVDGGGRIASMKLLSNGTTSSVKFLATTFSIYDGTSDVATFEVSGGNVYVAGSKVRTESMVANALTTGSDFEDDSSVSIGGVGVWTDIASATVSTLDATTRVLVNWAAYIGGSDDGTVCDARISRNGTVVWGPCTVAGNPPDFSYTFDTEGPITYQPLFNGMVSAFDADVPGSAGSYTYTLQMTTNNTGGPQWGASFRRLFALVFKR